MRRKIGSWVKLIRLKQSGQKQVNEDKNVIDNIIMPYRRWVNAIQLQNWDLALKETEAIINGVRVLIEQGWTYVNIMKVLGLIPQAGSTVRKLVDVIYAYINALQEYGNPNSRNNELNREAMVVEAYKTLKISLYNTAILITPINPITSLGLIWTPVLGAVANEFPVLRGFSKAVWMTANNVITNVVPNAACAV